nr:MAG TPA: hypothetical protein [Caudoviricetes sp.]
MAWAVSLWSSKEHTARAPHGGQAKSKSSRWL